MCSSNRHCYCLGIPFGSMVLELAWQSNGCGQLEPIHITWSPFGNSFFRHLFILPFGCCSRSWTCLLFKPGFYEIVEGSQNAKPWSLLPNLDIGKSFNCLDCVHRFFLCSNGWTCLIHSEFFVLFVLSLLRISNLILWSFAGTSRLYLWAWLRMGTRFFRLDLILKSTGYEGLSTLVMVFKLFLQEY